MPEKFIALVNPLDAQRLLQRTIQDRLVADLPVREPVRPDCLLGIWEKAQWQ